MSLAENLPKLKAIVGRLVGHWTPGLTADAAPRAAPYHTPGRHALLRYAVPRRAPRVPRAHRATPRHSSLPPHPPAVWDPDTPPSDLAGISSGHPPVDAKVRYS